MFGACVLGARPGVAAQRWHGLSDDVFDLVVVGAGAAGMTAAAVAAADGARVLLLEHAAQVGGTTAISGGMVWLPGNHLMAQAGMSDTLDAARQYLQQMVPPAADPLPLQAFLQHADEALRDLLARTALRLQPVLHYPDYEPDLPGATSGGRVLEPVPFDGALLGAHFARLRAPLPEFMLWGGMMISRADLAQLRRAPRSPRAALHVARLLARHGLQRLRWPRGTSLVLGNALAGRLFLSVIQNGVRWLTQASVQRLILDGARVSGVDYTHAGQRHRATARRGVVLASGGLSHDAALRARFVPPAAGPLTATMGSATACSGARLAQAVGAALSADPAQQAFWVPASSFTREDGSSAVFPHTVTDRGKPGLIAVDGQGRRFVNEAKSYHHFVRQQLRAGPDAMPAWLLCDSAFLWRYGLGRVKPFTRKLEPLLRTAYLRRGATLAELAQATGVPAATLQTTVERFNRGARAGEDDEFGRGGDIYQRHLGDADHRPNPCVAPIERAPFFAVAVQPADLGMAAGLVTDAHTRVLGADGQAIAGLYACGNDMQSVMNGAYPGPGITLGPSLVFGWRAARQSLADAS